MNSAHLLAVLFPPSKNALSILTTHEPVDLLTIHTPGFRAIRQAVAILEVDAMLVQEVPALLLVVFQEAVGEKVEIALGGLYVTHKKYRVPSADPSCSEHAGNEFTYRAQVKNEDIRQTEVTEFDMAFWIE